MSDHRVYVKQTRMNSRQQLLAFYFQLIACLQLSTMISSNTTTSPARKRISFQSTESNSYNSQNKTMELRPKWTQFGRTDIPRSESRQTRMTTTSSKYNVVSKTINKPALLGKDLYLPCHMDNPIAWLKGDYILFMDDMAMFDGSKFGSGMSRCDTCGLFDGCSYSFINESSFLKIIGKKVGISLRLFDIFEKNLVFIFLKRS